MQQSSQHQICCHIGHSLKTSKAATLEIVTCLVPTTWQKCELMYRNNGLLHRNVIIIITVGLLA